MSADSDPKAIPPIGQRGWSRDGGRSITRQTFTVTEAAEIIGVGRSTLYEFVKSGRVPSLRLGRRVVIPTHVIESMLTLQREHSGAPG